jgi:L-alanine-DL-glutamate epimerase-like enolase superfamily enzyme
LMKIDEIRIHHITLPFRGDFSHSCKTGSFARNMVVEVIADKGNIEGYGEGAPRVYVTGETQETTAASLKSMAKRNLLPREIRHVSEIWDFIDRLPGGKEHNAALCALELALLDALGKAENRSIMEYFSQDFSTERISYGAVLPLDSKKRIVGLSRFVRSLGISRLKIKLGRDFHQNREILSGVYQIFDGDCDLKTDVNGAWDRERAFKHIPLLRDYRIGIVEQPMKPMDPELVRFSQEIRPQQIRLMADESACSLAEVEDLVSEGHYDMFNIRLSKCGGFRRSLRIIEFLRARNMPFQVACQLGESGLLSAAGRVLSLLCKDAVYHEGSYDDYLLKENITKRNISFGWGGEAGPLGGVGLGVEVDVERLNRLCGSMGPVCILRA